MTKASLYILASLLLLAQLVAADMLEKTVTHSFVPMGNIRAKYRSIAPDPREGHLEDADFLVPASGSRPRVTEEMVQLTGVDLLEVGEAPPDELHEVVFQVRQKNKHLLLPMLLEVSAPRMERPFYSKDEVAKLTANPDASAAVESFLKAQGNDIKSYDMGPYGEYIKATAPVSVWSKLLNANFREFVVFFDEFDNVLNEPTKRLIRALEYSLPNFLVEHVEVVRNTVQVLPRRTLRPMSYETLDFTELKSAKDKAFLAAKAKVDAAQKKKTSLHMKKRSAANNDPLKNNPELSNGDCPPLTFRKLSTGECMSDVTVPTTINDAYQIPDNTGSPHVSQGILSMIDDVVSPDDLKLFQTRFNLPEKPIDYILGGHSSDALCQTNQSLCAEPNLDVQYLRAMSNSAEMWRFFTEDPLLFLTNLTALDNPPMVNSISYGYLEPELMSMDPTFISTFDHEAMKLGLRGITIIAASGDDGVASFMARNGLLFCGYTPSFPATSPYVTAVGGTQGIEQPDGVNKKEVAANCVPNTTEPGYTYQGVGGKGPGAGIVSGGGFSSTTMAPEFQLATIRNYFWQLGFFGQPWVGFSLTGRGYPDVSLASANYIVALGGSFYPVSGTSASAPTFAGMVSLVNAHRVQSGKGPIGYLNAAIWSTAHLWANDITSGDNNCVAGDCSICCPQGFKATKGWDPVTGFGTVNFPLFYNTFVNIEISAGMPQPDNPELGNAEKIIFPILGVLIIGAFGYVIYAYYLYPKDDRYAPIPDDIATGSQGSQEQQSHHQPQAEQPQRQQEA